MMLATRARLDPDRIAIEISGGPSLTFAEWDHRADAVASGLVADGLRPGERVGLVFGTRSWVSYAIAFCGVLRAGGVGVPCSAEQPAGYAAGVFAHCDARRVLDPEVLAGLERPAGSGPPEVRVRAGDPAQILYTSGTTGRPKGVAATHANLVFGAATHHRRRRLAHSERFVHAFPVGTNAGQTMLLNALDARPAALTLGRFTPARFARLVERSGAGSVFVVPAMAIELLRSTDLARYDLSRVLLLGSTAAALPPAVASQLARALPNATIVNYYSSTEAAPAQTSMIFDESRPDSVGRAVDGELRITGDTGAPMPPGDIGEVWLRSPFPREYFGDPAANREVFRDGWVRMGDLGRLDADGYLYLIDRERDVIKSGAHKVSTLRVEAELHEHPAVSEAAVFGVPHPVLGAEVTATVIVREPIEPTTLRTFLLDRLASYEVPARIMLVDQLPRNAGGKVLKRELAHRYAR
ncbi:MAG: AMP-binding protein [Dactylosporangium sp.]|nr:AMP-binding protein [Dactylosporangium sp.]NNJ59428.1 AMP-binding protein [Dactylosporangium sp.]